ncbi:MAG TPA: MiaB/RimO family radical SAM methylthiotransferase [Bacteroidales bacterium]|jgi:tRNA-2-methylthio-N6-dimethylallyladenosine synthase|nr:MiaB/RimO family radical SAM methylthiotransferase [Bacteroidales bacterium]
MKYYILTLGCQMNKSDSERVRTVIEGMGYRWTDNEEEADLLGILACSVRQKSIDKVYSRIARWNKWKNSRNLITFVSGCVLPADRDKFLRLFDLVFAMSELPDFPDMIGQYGVVSQYAIRYGAQPSLGKSESTGNALMSGSSLKMIMPPVEKIKDFWSLQPSYISEYEAFIPIQNGCDKFCTFCAVPYTRGREISRPSHEILSELKNVVEKGYKVITLLGQNVNSYGLDRHGSELTFPSLLRAIGEYGNNSGKEFWVYFTSPHPRDMSDEVLEMVASYACLAKQIHLPVQSGDDKVLIRMNRKHSVADYNRIIHSIRRLIAGATIFTDIIVGFTGESEEQFENTRKLMEAVRFNMAYIAIYSPRPGAASSRWHDDIPSHVKKERLHILTEELTRHTIEYNRGLIGKRLKILVTGRDRKPGYLSGITEGRIVVRFPSAGPVKPGTFVWLDITSAAPYSVEGEMVNLEVSLQMTV